MAFSALPTQTAGEVIDDTEWNAVVNDVNWLGQDHPKVLVYNGGTAITQASVVNLTWVSSLYNTGGIWNSGVNPSRFTAPSTGYYYFRANVVTLQLSESYPFMAMLYLNNTTEMARSSILTISGHQCGVTVGSIFYMAAGEYIQVRVFGDPSTGTTFDLVQDYRTSAMMYWLSA